MASIEIDIDELPVADYNGNECGTYKYLVAYKVTGTDHSGYCSGEDAREHDSSIKYVAIERWANTTNPDLDDFDYYEPGCTSVNGSGYCRGFGKQYDAIEYEYLGRYEFVTDIGDDYDTFIKFEETTYEDATGDRDEYYNNVYEVYYRVDVDDEDPNYVIMERSIGIDDGEASNRLFNFTADDKEYKAIKWTLIYSRPAY